MPSGPATAETTAAGSTVDKTLVKVVLVGGLGVGVGTTLGACGDRCLRDPPPRQWRALNVIDHDFVLVEI